MQRLECIYGRQATQGPTRHLRAEASDRRTPARWVAAAAGRRAAQPARGEPLLTFRRPSAACPPSPRPPYGRAVWASGSLTHANSAEFIAPKAFISGNFRGKTLLHYLEG